MKPVKRNNKTLLLLFLVLLYSGCSKEKISEESLVKIYVENVIADQAYTGNSDSLRIHKNAVFKKYGLTEKEFEVELGKYSQDKDAWARFFKSANEYLIELKKSKAIN